ncbi:MAG TPA: TonB-dependent receptor, partial [Saprospiraceae bacterium]|nr:TonB-dependent receptor [Saprospiraceae bacterium]
MKLHYLILLFVLPFFNAGFSQASETGLDGRVVDENGEAISFANVVLFNQADSTMAKAAYSEKNGNFSITHLNSGTYYLNISFVGYDTYSSPNLSVTENNILSLGQIKMSPFATELGEVVVASTKPAVEVKPDKTVFNIEGSINAIGNNALDLLRKAPGVVVDNNNRLMLIGKSGVKVYIDGKQSILNGDDLANYLKSLQSSQIESIEIITQPSSRYEADGNAGIINIRLIKDKSLGTNATASLSYDQATHGRYNANLNVNNRTEKINVFGNINYANGDNSEFNTFVRITPDIYAYQNRLGQNSWNNVSLRAGVDLTSGKNSTVGFLFDGYMNDEQNHDVTHSYIAPEITQPYDQHLEGYNDVAMNRDNYNFNGNYRYDNREGSVLNVDLDYGSYTSKGDAYQPNYYYDFISNQLTDTRIFSSHAPTTIGIKTVKLDYEKPLFGGTVGTGFKVALVNTDNTYNFYDVVDGNPVLDTDRSNRFKYDENVNAG